MITFSKIQNDDNLLLRVGLFDIWEGVGLNWKKKVCKVFPKKCCCNAT